MKWLKEFYRLCDLEDCYPALELLYKEIDHLLDEGKFEEVDLFLKAVDIDKVSPEVWYGILTITLAPRHELKNRSEVFEKIRTLLIEIDPLEKGYIERLR